jgi:hypothetical protein
MIVLNKITAADRYTNNEEGESVRTTPCVINPTAVRCFYPRKDNQPGTRITFTDGGGFAVLEPFETVAEKLGVSATELLTAAQSGTLLAAPTPEPEAAAIEAAPAIEPEPAARRRRAN